MQSLRHRIQRLEQRTGASTDTGLQLLVMGAGQEFALDLDRCAAVLRQCGFVRTGTGISVFDFSDVPHCLDARGLERYLRELVRKSATRGRRFCLPLESPNECDHQPRAETGSPEESPILVGL